MLLKDADHRVVNPDKSTYACNLKSVPAAEEQPR